MINAGATASSKYLTEARKFHTSSAKHEVVENFLVSDWKLEGGNHETSISI